MSDAAVPSHLHDHHPHPPVTSLHDAEPLKLMRVHAQDRYKVAILPFYETPGGEVAYVIYAPVPQKEQDHGMLLPFQIARGTLQARYKLGERMVWRDKGRGAIEEGAEWVEGEAPLAGALREAEEELGLGQQHIRRIYDCGLLPYQNPRGQLYHLHMFLARITDGSVLAAPDPYACAARQDGVTFADIQRLSALNDNAAQRPFKPSYMTLMEALHDTVMECIISSDR